MHYSICNRQNKSQKQRPPKVFDKKSWDDKTGQHNHQSINHESEKSQCHDIYRQSEQQNNRANYHIDETQNNRHDQRHNKTSDHNSRKNIRCREDYQRNSQPF